MGVQAGLGAWCLCAAMVPLAAKGQASLTFLDGFAGDDRTFAFGVSLDGRVVGGNSGTLTSRRGFAWEDGVGYTPLVGSGVFHSVTAVAGGGGWLGGVSSNRPAVWARAGGGPTLMPTTIFGGGQVLGLSGDGSLAVGLGVPSVGPQGAFVWHVPTGSVAPIASLAGTVSSQANGISADGSLVVGAGSTASGPTAWVWSVSTGTVSLPTPSGASRAWAQGVSLDGVRVVGYSGDGLAERATAWEYVGGGWEARVLGMLSGDTRARARAASAGGAWVVGQSFDAGGESRAFVWSDSWGMRDLGSVLEGMGVALGGFRLESATGISADGRTIVGYGFDPSGRTRGFVAVIPSPWGLLVLAGLLGRGGRRDATAPGFPGR